ncbi:MAG: hypothetical protein IPH48_16470 [bacterium]|nr:hypothetical protein [bacterium]
MYSFSARTSPLGMPPMFSHTSVVSFQRATLWSAVPPDDEKLPPAYVVPPMRSMAKTLKLKPAPIASQAGGGMALMGFSRQRAIRRAPTPPAVVKMPPAMSSFEPLNPGYLNDSSA